MGAADAEPTDGALVERARHGDPAAFSGLVRRHYRAAYLVALGQLGNPMDAEDACQDAFVRALEHLDDCRDPDRFVGWLLRIVRNRAHNLRDYLRVREATDIDETPVAGPSRTDRDEERAALGQRLTAALAKLNEVQRAVVILHDVEGYRHREIAVTLGISEGMARQHLFGARKMLRNVLGDHAVEEYFRE